jgi:hypothetical protein
MRAARPLEVSHRSGFTILDVIIVVAIISILLALLSPALSRAQEQARRTVCAANMKQTGLGITMWVGDHKGVLPQVEFAEMDVPQTPRRLQLGNLGEYEQDWDGLGLLVSNQYISSPEIFYCPSHTGEHSYDRYRAAWNQDDQEIVLNYHYRWLKSRDQFLDNLNPDVTLVTDGLRTVSDYSHGSGNNMLKADMRVDWFADNDGILVSFLPTSLEENATTTYTAKKVMTALDLGTMPRTRDELDRLSPFINAGLQPKQ